MASWFLQVIFKVTRWICLWSFLRIDGIFWFGDGISEYLQSFLRIWYPLIRSQCDQGTIASKTTRLEPDE
ncbi:hypothetical protein BRADI_3g23025v3 [Brachypodium distachyon]|uniref:Uncharacterized protein n=1 Tax=Brachypodium distachyon TaxID=15368 RepID=A0A2K2CYX8_BRADI|nr:hypothetical protein BRADI_3g23025v3 [Brachypodium distachyon]